MNTNEAPILLPTGSPEPTTTQPEPSSTDELTSASDDEAIVDPTGQLLLLDVGDIELTESSEHARFRLNKPTRERGLRHVAEIRAQLAAAKERRGRPENVVSLPPRRQPAA